MATTVFHIGTDPSSWTLQTEEEGRLAAERAAEEMAAIWPEADIRVVRGSEFSYQDSGPLADVLHDYLADHWHRFACEAATA